MKHGALALFAFVCITSAAQAMEITPQQQPHNYPPVIQLCLDAIIDKDMEKLKQGLSLDENFNYDLDNKISLLHIACSSVAKDESFALEILKKKHIDLTMQANEDGCSALHAACKNNFPNVASIILEQNPQTAYLITKEGELPIHIAAEHGHKDCITVLLNHDKTNLYQQDYQGNTPLHTACAAMQLNTIEQLIESGARATIKNYHQETPFYTLFFSLNGNLEDFLANSKPFIKEILIHSTDEHKNTQLHLCAQTYMNRSQELALYQHYILFLCANNVDKNAKNNNQQTALDLASKLHRKIHKQYSAEKMPYMAQCFHNQTFITKSLLAIMDTEQENKIMSNEENNIPCEKLSKTISFCKTGTLNKNKYLCNTDNITLSLAITTCLKGIQTNSIRVVKIGKKMGADMNKDGYSLLCRACETNNNDIIKKILEYTSTENVIAIDVHTGDTPLHIACERNRPIIVQWILDKNPAAAFALNTRKFSPFNIAMGNGDAACFECILKKHPHIATETTNEKNQSLLQQTIINLHNREHTKALLAITQKNINHQDHKGNTALHLACDLTMEYKNQQCDIIQLLIINGAKTTIKNNLHATPLMILFSRVGSHTLDYLLTQYPGIAEALLHIQDNNNNTQLHLCTKLHSLNADKLRNYISFLASHKIDIQARNKDRKRAIDIASELYYVLYKKYIKTRSPYIKNALNTQECIMHELLRSASPYTQCALFKAILALQDRDEFKQLPPELITYIMFIYYVLNIETIAAKKYKGAFYYTSEHIENKNNMKQQLIIHPEPALLWS